MSQDEHAERLRVFNIRYNRLKNRLGLSTKIGGSENETIKNLINSL